jgi:hypothetical protein
MKKVLGQVLCFFDRHAGVWQPRGSLTSWFVILERKCTRCGSLEVNYVEANAK